MGRSSHVQVPITWSWFQCLFCIMAKRAVILLSGGLDSATVLAMANAQGYESYALSFRYGQRHSSELEAARKIARLQGAIRHEIIDLDLRKFGGSALTDADLAVPIDGVQVSGSIPITYVPARNTIMLSVALGWAEVLEANDVFFGANAVDYSGYPDCRPEYVRAFETMANLATRAGVEGKRVTIHAPIIQLSKAEIICAGLALGVEYSQTVSCYQADAEGLACGVCESCRLRKEGFRQAGVEDPTRYQSR